MPPPEDKYVSKHLGRIQEEIDLGAIDKSPINRNLIDAQPGAIRHMKNFKIETEPIRLLLGEHELRSFA